MSLGADILAALPGLRAAAESLHQDTFTVWRATGNRMTDPVTLEETDELSAVVTGVMGKLQTRPGSTRPGSGEIPGQSVVESELMWHTSVNTVGVLTDDIVECTAIGPLGDPEQVGKRVRVTGPFMKSLATARRFSVEEQS